MRLCWNVRKKGISPEVNDAVSEPFFHFNQVSVSQVWNSDALRSVRKAMLRGEALGSCVGCYQDEALGKTSKRQVENRRWNLDRFKDLIEHSAANDGNCSESPRSIDLRLGNACNLQCRSCGPLSSRPLEKEFQSLRAAGHVFPHAQEELDAIGSQKLNWFEGEEYLEDLNQLLPHLEIIAAYGGEPVLNRSLIKILGRCRERELSGRMGFRFVSNLTLLPKDFYDYAEDFSWVSAGFSIDAWGEKNDFLRHPSKFSKLESNLREVLQSRSEKFSFTIIVTLQALNALEIPKLLENLLKLCLQENRKCDIAFNVLREPDFLGISALPQSVLQTAAMNLEKYLLQMETSSPEDSPLKKQLVQLWRPKILDAVSVLKHEKSQHVQHWKMLTNFMDVLDQSRGHDWKALYPEFKDLGSR